MKRSLLASLLALALVAAPRAQDEPGADSSAAAPGFVVVETNLPAGLLSANGALLGAAGDGAFELEPGVYALALVEPNREAWRARRAEAEVTVLAGETARVRLDVPYRYRVESFPYGAAVTLESEAGPRVLGETPLTVESDAPLDGEFVVAAPGHQAARQPAGAAADNAYSFVLKPLDAFETAAEVGLGERRPNVWIDVAAAGLALSAGAVAVYYKQKGDARYDDYARSGDPALRPEFERYDTYSAVALGAMQVGLGVLAVRLVLR
jgi:hypothetical protein